jgi:membrane associated rhomboid family serine protease
LAANGLLLIPILYFYHFSGLDPQAVVSTFLTLLLLIGPLLLQRQLVYRVMSGDWDLARKKAVALKCMMPLFPAGECRLLLDFLQRGEEEDLPEEFLLNLRAKSAAGLMICAEIHFRQAQWDLSGRWLESLTSRDIRQLSRLSLLKVRALCESGRLEEAAEETLKLKHSEQQLGAYVHHLLYLFCFSGDDWLLRHAFAGRDRSLSQENRIFWQGVCRYFNEEKHLAGEAYLYSQQHRQTAQGRAARALLARPPESCKPLPPEMLSQLARELNDNYEDYGTLRSRGRPCTVLFLWINLVVFAALPRQLSLEGLTLAIPYIHETQQWWRLLTTTFVHENYLHCLNNMLMLVIFGNLIEPFFRGWRYLLIYLGGGLAGMFFMTFTYSQGNAPYIVLGASGSTMALLGAYMGLLWRQNRRLALRQRRWQFIFLSTLLLMQFTTDILSPNISLSAHILGLAFGAPLAYFLYRPRTLQEENDFERRF